jgi:ankyrin repeat protein
MSRVDEKLVSAARAGDTARIERQIAAGADPNVFEGMPCDTPLQEAANNGHVAAIAALLKAGARVDGADSFAYTPLMNAAFNGHTAAIDALLAAGADVNHANRHGNTALHLALMWGKVAAAHTLLEAGARADMRDDQGKRPIDVVRAQPVRSWWLCAHVTQLRRRVPMCRCAPTVTESPMRRP